MLRNRGLDRPVQGMQINSSQFVPWHQLEKKQQILMEVVTSEKLFPWFSPWRKSTLSPIGFIHLKMSTRPTKQSLPSFFIHCRKMMADGCGITPLGFIHFEWMYEAQGGTVVPPWASHFSHEICKITLKNWRGTLLVSYISKHVRRGGGVQNPWGEWLYLIYIYIYVIIYTLKYSRSIVEVGEWISWGLALYSYYCRPWIFVAHPGHF